MNTTTTGTRAGVTSEMITSIRRRILTHPAISTRRWLMKAFLMDLDKCYTCNDICQVIAYWNDILPPEERS